MSNLIRISLGLALGLGFTAAAETAEAGCKIYKPAPINPCVDCKGPVTGKSTLPPLSSYFEHEARCGGKVYRPKTVTHNTAPSIQTVIVQNAGASSAPQTAIVQNSGVSSPQTAIVQNSGVGSAPQTAIVQNSGVTSGAQTAIVQNSGSITAPQTAIVQNSGSLSAPQTAIVQNSGTSLGSQTAIVQNNHVTTHRSVRVHPPRYIHPPRVIHPPRIIYPPAPRPTYYRVVHPVIPVPYPVPTPVPVCVNSICGPRPQTRRSRYGY